MVHGTGNTAATPAGHHWRKLDLRRPASVHGPAGALSSSSRRQLRRSVPRALTHAESWTASWQWIASYALPSTIVQTKSQLLKNISPSAGQTPLKPVRNSYVIPSVLAANYERALRSAKF